MSIITIKISNIDSQDIKDNDLMTARQTSKLIGEKNNELLIIYYQ